MVGLKWFTRWWPRALAGRRSPLLIAATALDGAAVVSAMLESVETAPDFSCRATAEVHLRCPSTASHCRCPPSLPFHCISLPLTAFRSKHFTHFTAFSSTFL